jgi:hypothetical protein
MAQGEHQPTAASAAASMYNILRDGQFYRSDKQTIELLRAVRRWEGGGRDVEDAVFQSGLKSGRIMEGRVTAQTLSVQAIDTSRHVDQSLARTAYTPNELQSAIVLRLTPEAASQAETPDPTAPTRQSVDPPQRQIGGARNTALQSTSSRDRPQELTHAAVTRVPGGAETHSKATRATGQGRAEAHGQEHGMA